MKKILVVSDTHGEYDLLNELILIENPDYILHCGDHQFKIDYLLNNKIYYVNGNSDYFTNQYGKEELILNIDGLNICVIHGHKQYSINWHTSLYKYFKTMNPDIICYGHSHKEVVDELYGVKIINPGSITYPRNKYFRKSYILIYIYENKNYDINIKYID